MRSIHFAEVRKSITLGEVLALLDFVVVERSGQEVRGRCPIHGSTSPKSRSFSANVGRNVYRCFSCGSAGNQLDLYAAATGLPLYAAAIDLCTRLGREVPWKSS